MPGTPAVLCRMLPQLRRRRGMLLCLLLAATRLPAQGRIPQLDSLLALARQGDAGSAARLEHLAPYPKIWTDPNRELKILRAVDGHAANVPVDVALTRVRMEVERGSADSAALALDRLVARGGVSGALALHIKAEVAFARGENDAGEAAYFDGASQVADSADIEMYTADISWIETPDESDEWKVLPNESARVTWLRRFWSGRDLEDARMPGSRLAEQFRRWRVSLGNYRWDRDGSTARGVPQPIDSAMTHADFTVVNHLFATNAILDDRGRLYMRHGEPERKANLPGIEAIDAEVWAWATQPKATIVGFTGVGSLRFGMLARNLPEGDAMTICNLDAWFCVPMTRARKRILVEKYTAMRETAESTDGNPESYHSSVDGIIQAYGIPNGGTLIVVAIPVAKLLDHRGERDTASTTAVRIRVVVGDSASDRIVAAFDTVRSWNTPSGVSKSAFVTAHFTVPVPVGEWDVSVVLGDTAHRAGSGVRFPRVPVPAFTGKSLALSDPIIGRAGSGLSWQHNGESFPLNPTNAWRRDEPALLSYEVDGQVTGRSYETRYELWKTTGKPKAPTSVITSKSVARAMRETVHRELSLKELAEGTYRLVIRVKDVVSGQESARERMVPVRK